MSTAMKETLKTIARGLYFGVLGLIALVLTVVISSPDVAQATLTVPVFNFTISAGALIVAGAAALLKIVDRYRHKSDSPSNGIAPPFLQR